MISQTRIVNAHYYVVEKFSESFQEEPVTVLRTIRVMKADATDFYARLANAVRNIYNLPTPSVQNVTAAYSDLIRNGVLRGTRWVETRSPADNTDFPTTYPAEMPGDNLAFIHFEDAVSPTYVDIFFFLPPGKGYPAQYQFTVYLGHSIIAGPVSGISLPESQPPVPTEPLPPPS